MNSKEQNILKNTYLRFKENGYCEFTQIQEEAIPCVLQGRDLIALAKTGSGKTAAFLLPMVELFSENQKSLKSKEVRSLILTPTRELATQIEVSANYFSNGLDLKVKAIFGGVSKEGQLVALKFGVDFLVATPGRLIDLIERGHIDFSALEIFVLDEADMMLDMGFLNDVQKILNILPLKKQTLLFSATMPGAIEGLANNLLKDPLYIEVDKKTSAAETIKQKLYTIEKSNKVYLLNWLFENSSFESILIFCKTKFGAERIIESISKSGVLCASLHSEKSQAAREKALQEFKDGKIRVLVATDIAARGIDIQDVSLVVNFNLPEDPRNYIHRIGRTGRAGKTGLAISFCVEAEVILLKSIGKLMGQKIEVDSNQPFHKEISFAFRDSVKSKKSKKRKRKR